MGESSRGSLVSRKLRIVVIGSGNVASALAPSLNRSGSVEIAAVYSRTAEHARRLASQLSCPVAVSAPSEVPVDADLYLVSVTDGAIARVAEDFSHMRGNAIWAHTSGSVGVDVLAPLTPNYGVFYPLQTFSLGVDVDFGSVPMFIEGANRETLDTLLDLAKTISPKVYEADSELRGKMHAAAVFACNFVNFLWTTADDVLHREAGLDISVLAPLIAETQRKAMKFGPGKVQTGPAVRGDHQVMEKHLNLLTPHEGELYKVLSKSIMDYYNI